MLLSTLTDIWRQVLPLSVTRIHGFVSSAAPYPYSATLFAAAVFVASGLFNVLVYTSTRPGLLRPDPTAQTSQPTSGRPTLPDEVMEMDFMAPRPHDANGNETSARRNSHSHKLG